MDRHLESCGIESQVFFFLFCLFVCLNTTIVIELPGTGDTAENKMGSGKTC